MYIKTVVLLLCLTLIVLLVNNTFKQQLLQKQPAEMNQAANALQQQVEQLHQRLNQQGDQVLAVAQKQLQTAAHQSQLIDQQINTLDAVVEDLAMQQMQQKQMRDVQASLRQEALHAANRVAGLSVASSMKMAVVEYYLGTGEYPNSNSQLGLLDPGAYADENIQTITVSAGGHITVVYTARSGFDGGAISLSPNAHHGMI